MANKVLFKGIDVSKHQGVIDWSKVKNKIDFAIIRCGYGGDYTKQDDTQWKNNVAACEKYGIPYGVYLYSYATTVEKAKSEAAHTIRLLKGHKPDMPVFLDLEDASVASIGKKKILEITKVYCECIEKAGYNFGVYANKYWFSTYLTDKWYDSKIKWVAQFDVPVYTYKGTLDIWQHTDKGSIPGISGNIDMNYCYTSFVKGDVNNDGKVTAADARIILRVSAKLEVLKGQAAKNADMNGDGKTTAADAQTILQKSAGVKT